MNEFLLTILGIIGEMSPYLLLGFLIAGLLQAYVPQRLYSRHFSRPNMSSVVKSALMGIPLPLCSCGVIPTAVALRKKGASRGATMSFLISTPQTGVDSILATYSLLGPAMAIYRPLVALVTSIFGGWLTNRSETPEERTEESNSQFVDNSSDIPSGFFPKLKYALSYGFVEMIADVGKWLVIGLLLAAVITVAIPDSWFRVFAESPWLSYLLVLILTLPMYVCATGSLPIAVSFLMKGLSPGSAMIFLMVGPATNAASLLVVDKVLGRRTTVAYLVSVIVGALLSAVAIDFVLPAAWFATPVMFHHGACCHDEGISTFQAICTVVFALLLLNALVLHKHHHHHHDTDIEPSMSPTVETAGEQCVYEVKGMTCSHCQRAVTDAIRQTDGVNRVEVSLSDGRAVVEGSASADDIIKAVEQIGYDCKKL